MKIIMHKNSMDVVFDIIRRQYHDSKRTKYRGQWLSLGYTAHAWPVSQMCSLTIKTEDWKNWQILSHSSINKPRTKSGLPEGDY